MIQYFETAIELDAKNRRAAKIAEFVYAQAGDYDAVLRVLKRVALVGASREDRVEGALKVARLYAQKLKNDGEALEAYQQALDISPGQPEALAYVASVFEQAEEWDHLVALYEDQLKGGIKGEGEQAVLSRIALVHWHKRDRADAAEPYFDKLRRLDPTNDGMLAFFREVTVKRNETSRFVAILTDAQRTTNDPGDEEGARRGDRAACRVIRQLHESDRAVQESAQGRPGQRRSESGAEASLHPEQRLAPAG